MYMEFVRSCALMPEFEVRITAGGTTYLMTDVIELHKTQVVGLVSDGTTTDKKLVALNFNQISSFQVPPKFEKLYLEIMRRVNLHLQTLSKGNINVLNAKQEALYNAFYHVLGRDGSTLFRELSE